MTHQTKNRRTKQRGQVLVITLLAMTLLVALIFYVYNIGDRVNRRLELQNTADAAAVSGAGWVARSMNVIAMNNCQQSRILALVPVMDSLPLATSIAADEMEAFYQALDGQVDRGLPQTNEDYLADGIESLRNRMAQQRDILQAAADQFNDSSLDISGVTNYPSGSFWQAAETLDELSQATVESAGRLAQSNAVQFGRENNAAAAFLMPLEPTIPAKRGEFTDFQPVLQGQTGVRDNVAFYESDEGMGGAIPDFAGPHTQYRMGPWARLYEWRYNIYRYEGGTWVDGPGVRPGSGQVNLGGRQIGNSVIQTGGGHWAGGESIPIGYEAYGPYRWALNRARDFADDEDHLPDSYFPWYLEQIADIKLGYMFGPKTLRSVHVPQWIVDYQQCRQIAGANVTQTMFFLVEIISSVPESSEQWMSPGTYSTNGEYPISVCIEGWEDPEAWGIVKKANHVWKDTWTYQTTEDSTIGIEPTPVDPDDPESELEYHDVYVVQWYVFGGIDTGGNEEVSNPCDWEDDDPLPAPMMLDITLGDYDPENPDCNSEYRRKYFSFLGVARGPSQAGVWPAQFPDANPSGMVLTLAQAKVFNNTSWDLWTQDWRTNLTPVTGWDAWMDEMDAAVGAGGMDQTISAEELQAVYNYLQPLGASAAEELLGH